MLQKSKNKTLHSSLVLGAIGIVYGDIGTSPLYALKSCFSIGHLPVTPVNILGLISLFFWLLIIVVSFKYVRLIMHFSNQGEGGVLALSSLFGRLKITRYGSWPLALGIGGAALLFGDGVITPAISVLGALEGLEVVAPSMEPYIIYGSILIITLLFLVQNKGSGAIGNFFGPIMVLWFISLAILGVFQIIQAPAILMALSPHYALQFFWHNGLLGFVALGGAILVITGAEALYADLGHFGRHAISASWGFFVLPCLTLNYLGQGALLLNHPQAVSNPFYLMAPQEVFYPLLILSTVATIIASQAIISGVYSVARQASMLNHLPRMKVRHTSNQTMGQVYMPAANTLLYVLTVGAIWHFEKSDNLAAAYGLSVACTMLISSLLVLFLCRRRLHWSRSRSLMIFLPLLILDFVFVVTNALKFFDGAWYTVLITAVLCYVAWVWRQGNRVLNKQRLDLSKNLVTFLADYEKIFRQRIPGTAIFMSHSIKHIPNSLVIHLNHHKFLHEKILFVSIQVLNAPHVPKNQHYAWTSINDHTGIIQARYGFKDTPDINRLIKWAVEQHLLSKKEDVSVYFSKGVAVPSENRALDGLSEKIYVFLTKNAYAAHEFYRVPEQAVVEFGARYKV